MFGSNAADISNLASIQLKAMHRGILNSLPVAFGALKSGVPFMKGSVEHLAGQALDYIIEGKLSKDNTLNEAIKEFKDNNLSRNDVDTSLLLNTADRVSRDAQREKYPAISRYIEKSIQDGSKKYQQSLPGKLGYALTYPERGIQAVHTVSYAMNYELSIASRAHESGISAGFKGDELSTYIEKYVKRPPAKAALESHNEALNAIFMEESKHGGISDWASKFINNEIPVFRVVTQLAVPFVKISLKIAEAGLVDSTPLGFIKESIRKDIRGDNGYVARQNAIAKMSAGSLLGMSLVGMAAEGGLTGSMPIDPKEREKLPPGWKPNAFHIGEVYIPIPKWAGKFSDLIVAASTLGTTGRYLSNQDYHHAAVALSAGLGDLMDENFMGSLAKLSEAISSKHGAITFINDVLPSLAVPYSTFQSQIEREIDPYARQVTNQGPSNLWGLLPRIEAKTFLAGELLLPKYDVYGDPMPGETQVSIGRGGTNPIQQKLSELDIGIAPCKYVMGGVRLTDKEYNEFTRISGGLIKQNLGAIVSAPFFPNISHSQQAIQIADIVKNSRDVAFAQLQIIHPDLIDRVYQANLLKIEKRQ